MKQDFKQSVVNGMRYSTGTISDFPRKACSTRNTLNATWQPSELHHALGNRVRHRATNLITFSGQEDLLMNVKIKQSFYQTLRTTWLVLHICLDSVSSS